MSPIEKDPLQQKLEKLNWAILALLVLISLIFMKPPFTLGVLLGGLISIMNFIWLKRDLRVVFGSLTGRAKAAVMFRYYIRFFVSAVIIFFIITRTVADVLGLLVGLSIVVINIILSLLMNLSKKNLIEEVK
ncbi:MAG: ATP synthase I chain [Syntrophaceae bacterium PtaB.Bin095]|nr:MAG: ATP synthase I chain [Syntrophaceae bacterium PtaB.Bin095]